MASRLRTLHCHCYGSGLIPGPGASTKGTLPAPPPKPSEATLHTCQKQQQIRNAAEDVAQREPALWRWECKSIRPLWRRVRRFLTELKAELPQDPGSPRLGISRRGHDITVSKRPLHLMCSIAHSSQDTNQPKCPRRHERTEKLW